MTFDQFLPLLIPLIVLQLALMRVGLFDLTRPERRVSAQWPARRRSGPG